MSQPILTLSQLPHFVREFLDQSPKGLCLGLTGELGSGKTTFVREVVRQLAEGEGSPVPTVASPSFVLHQKYVLERPVDHFDLYRLESVTESTLIEIGFFDAMAEARLAHGFVFVEWAENAPLGLLDLDRTLTITLEQTGRRYKLK